MKMVFLDCKVHAEYACSKATEEMCHCFQKAEL